MPTLSVLAVAGLRAVRPCTAAETPLDDFLKIIKDPLSVNSTFCDVEKFIPKILMSGNVWDDFCQQDAN